MIFNIKPGPYNVESADYWYHTLLVMLICRPVSTLHSWMPYLSKFAHLYLSWIIKTQQW